MLDKGSTYSFDGDEGFIEYLRSLGTLSEKSIKDDMSRINSMKSRGIDYILAEKNMLEIIWKKVICRIQR
ncbi:MULTISPECIES: hypothetical protein [Clostridium]|uniref:Uncharacterized protein n=1 Tax=Clostridium lapidicellarium TaxID=3240931 RepID=A0ABV4DZN6_9CLOT